MRDIPAARRSPVRRAGWDCGQNAPSGAAPDLRPAGLENRISSLRVAGGESWEVCEGRNFTGRCDVFSGEDADLRKRGWNDRISSLRPARIGGRDRALAPVSPAIRGLQL